MKKLLFPFPIVFALLLGCQKDDSVEIYLRVKNVGKSVIDEFLVQGEAIKYSKIVSGETTGYKQWEFTSRPDTFEVRTEMGNYGPLVINYTPEYAKMENGFYTMEVDSTLIIRFIKD